MHGERGEVARLLTSVEGKIAKLPGYVLRQIGIRADGEHWGDRYGTQKLEWSALVELSILQQASNCS